MRIILNNIYARNLHRLGCLVRFGNTTKPRFLGVLVNWQAWRLSAGSLFDVLYCASAATEILSHLADALACGEES